VLAYRIREGYFGDVTLADLKLVLVISFEGNLWASQATDFKVGLFVDSSANSRQQEALQMVFSGQAGGSRRACRRFGVHRRCSGWKQSR